MPRIMLSFSISDFATVTCLCFLVLQKCSSVAVLGIHFEVKLFNDWFRVCSGGVSLSKESKPGSIPWPRSAPRRRPFPAVRSGTRTVKIMRVPTILQKDPQSLMKSTRGPGPLSPPLPYPLPTLLSGGGRVRRCGGARARCGSGRARPDAAAGGTAGCRRAAGWPGAAAVRMPRLGAAPRPLSFPTSGGQARRRPSATGVAPRAKARRGGGAAPSGPSPTSGTGHGGCQA